MMKNITPIALLLASLGIFFGYVNPTYTGTTGAADTSKMSIKELQTEAADYNDALNKTREIELTRDGLLAKYNAMSDIDKERINKLLPDHIDSVRLIIDINNIAAKYGMSLSDISLSGMPSAPAAAGTASGTPAPVNGPNDLPYNSVKLGFSVTGNYSDFYSFLKELEESLRVVDVTSLSFSAAKTSSGQTAAAGSGAFTYTMTIRPYYLK